MNRDTQNIVLILLGGAVVRIVADGTYLRYVKPSLAPYLLTAGILTLLLGTVSLIADRRAILVRRTRGERGHDHVPGVAWLLVLPVLTLFLVAPASLGSYAADRDDNRLPPPPAESVFPPLPSPEAGADWVELSLSGYYTRAVFDQGRTLGDRPVRLTGFVTARPAGGFYVTRMIISCCAADAQAIKVIALSDVPIPAVDTWVAVVGTWHQALDHPDGYAEPALTATSVQVIDPPELPYER